MKRIRGQGALIAIVVVLGLTAILFAQTPADRLRLLSRLLATDGTVPEAALSTSDNTTANASTSKHGLAPKGTAGTSQFWRQDWTLATPAGGGDVSGPGVAVTDGHLAIWDGTSGTVIKDGGAPSGGAAQLVQKPADESVTSSTVLQNDDDLAVSLVTSGDYVVEGLLLVTGAQAGDIKVTFTVPASATGNMTFTGQIVAATTNDSLSRNLAITDFTTPDFATFGSVSTSAANSVVINGAIYTAGSSGTLQLQWAQNGSNGTATVVGKGSWLRVTKTN